jgi:hypothetical protein
MTRGIKGQTPRQPRASRYAMDAPQLSLSQPPLPSLPTKQKGGSPTPDGPQPSEDDWVIPSPTTTTSPAPRASTPAGLNRALHTTLGGADHARAARCQDIVTAHRGVFTSDDVDLCLPISRYLRPVPSTTELLASDLEQVNENLCPEQDIMHELGIKRDRETRRAKGLFLSLRDHFPGISTEIASSFYFGIERDTPFLNWRDRTRRAWVATAAMHMSGFAEGFPLLVVNSTLNCPYKFAIGDAVRFVSGDQYGSGTISTVCAANSRVVTFDIEGELWSVDDDEREDTMFFLQVPAPRALTMKPGDQHATLWACEIPDVASNLRGDVSFTRKLHSHPYSR